MLIIIIVSLLVVAVAVFVVISKKKKTPPPTPSQPVATPTPEVKVVAPQKVFPACDYPPFNHSRMITVLGLSEEDAQEFVTDLIAQIEETIPLIQEDLDTNNFESMERNTHSIKGSATNLGTGSVADLLVEFNTYLKTSKDKEIAQHYFDHLKKYAKSLQQQYA